MAEKNAIAVSRQSLLSDSNPLKDKEITMEALERLDVLADRHRVPAWQAAALARFMGWAEGKMVTDPEYKTALDKLSVRRLGGGRR